MPAEFQARIGKSLQSANNSKILPRRAEARVLLQTACNCVTGSQPGTLCAFVFLRLLCLSFLTQVIRRKPRP